MKSERIIAVGVGVDEESVCTESIFFAPTISTRVQTIRFFEEEKKNTK